MSKPTTKTVQETLSPKWGLIVKANKTLATEAILVFRARSWPDRWRSARQAAVNTYLDEFRESREFVQLKLLREKVTATDAELATARDKFETIQSFLSTSVCSGDSDETEVKFIEARQRAAFIEAKRLGLIEALPEVYRAAELGHSRFTVGMSADQMAAAKPVLAEIATEIESVVSPLLTPLHDARETFASAGAVFRKHKASWARPHRAPDQASRPLSRRCPSCCLIKG